MQFTSVQTKASRPCTPVRALRCGAQAKQSATVSRRTAAALVASLAVAVSAAPAQAFLGIGEDPGKEYTEKTGALLTKINATLALGPEEDKEAAVKALKKDMNDWTAKYRNSGLAGRPSFSNLYSVVNALAGHWNNFGADAPVPKKRRGRIDKEIEDATKLLSRGR